jgi:ribonucleoside-diphosphate reductase alpha chain
MSIQALSSYTFNSKYARHLSSEKRRETWDEAVQRVFDMHRKKYADAIIANPELGAMIDYAQKMQRKKRTLAAARSLQFGGETLFKHELKMYGCLATHINRPRVFQECMYALLCGCGVGFSVQDQHVLSLSKLQFRSKVEKVFVPEDSIEGWADCVGVLMSSYFQGKVPFPEYQGITPVFDFSKIRPEGALIAGQFKAPGPEPLKYSLQRIDELIKTRLDTMPCDFSMKLRPIDCYDIVMHIADAVLSGGVRRSATLCLFTHTNEKMLNAKIGDWQTTNKQRSRSNNSAALLKGSVTKEEFSRILQSTREFGEPAFVWLDDLDIIFNPCCEIGMIPVIDGKTGWQACNLTEINGKWCNDKESFLDACRASAIIGTLQAGYTNIPYLGKVTENILKREALLGCSITGWMDNPEVLFDPKIQRAGAKLILETNAAVAAMIGINQSARTTCVKPSGTISCLLGTASGIHPHHAKRYIRRVQAKANEFCLNVTERLNPSAVEDGVWGGSGNETKDKVISFLCEVPPGSVVKNQLGALELLEKVRLTQQNWVEYGTRPELATNPKVRHNVSNTITVRPNEWEAVEKYIFKNQDSFAGISLLSSSGDLDYAQAPFSTVLTPTELVREYGDSSVFASGLIVAGLEAFDNNLWLACDTALGKGEKLDYEITNKEPAQPDQHSPKLTVQYHGEYALWKKEFLKVDFIRRLKQFALRYFNNDLKQATYCLKHVSLWKTWCDLTREYVEIDWSTIHEENAVFVNADTLGATACAGGQCELK